jgi:hypothetical protein
MTSPTERPLLYLSGPMKGYPGFNYTLFHRATAHLRDRGYRIINPAETAGGETDLTRGQYMRIDLGYVMASDGVVVLPGWRSSQGALLEIAAATNLGLPVRLYDLDKDDLGRTMEVSMMVKEVLYVC